MRLRWSAWFWLAMLAGALIRLAILPATSGLDTHIVDEQHYRELATSLSSGRGFSWSNGALTSIRPPLYPAMIALVWKVTGSESLQAIRAVQIVLSLITAAAVYALGRRAFNPAVGRVAAAIFWLYPAFVLFDFLVLTETLYTLWLVLFVLLAIILVQSGSGHRLTALLCGLVLGLSCLTRSVLWPLPLVICPMLLTMPDGTWARRLVLTALFLAGFTTVIAPWAIRNTRVQGVLTIVDTMGGINLRMGNYEYTPDDRMWDAVALTGPRSWVYEFGVETAGRPATEGEKDKWAQRKAIAYIATHPATTARRAAIKFADFWGLEREFVAGVQQGFFHPPQWFTILATVAILGGYVLVAVIGAGGAWLAEPADWRVRVWLLLPIVAIMLAHSLVFGHSRYHVPLIPLLGVFAAALLVRGREAVRHATPWLQGGAALTALLLISIWLRQVVFSDFDRLRSLF
jgi:4-amino-4-deoxy-L-arabinose transferase-like glycosyltransferase